MSELQKYKLTLNINYQADVDGKIKITGISSINKIEGRVIPIVNAHRKVLASIVKLAIEKKAV